MLNQVVLIGRLTRDPELRYTTSGKAVANIGLAVDRGTTTPNGEKEADFIDIVVWDKQAETVANYLKKGRLIAVTGRLQIRRYETQDGQRRDKAEVVANQVRFLPDGSKGTDGPARGGKDTGIGQDTEFVGDDDDVPF